ncbi:DNA polymerase delta subunit 3-like [Apis dorsata]|uniref:DNA polymerase delta subunit 3-like n=1 Tax=Apis dorsata TaxID=7462 RepID=UPI0003DF600D|nr:DNA polymerase delta subunit 3-like [Apis dorsata]XP_031370468.1 DNA polymerase delta subunit 3-like [Apis dorsata]
MITESLHEYLEIVAGYIFDDDKLVTYKWLSKVLEVHVNIAKQILWEFWQKYKKEKEFVCTFLLMGILYDNGMHVEIVKEKDLITSKEKYSKVISEHIYSLQKILPEIQLLGNTENGDIKFSAIKCIENNERNDEEMHIFRWGPISSEIQFAPQEEAQSISESNEEKKIISPEKKQTLIKKNERKGFDNLFGKIINKQKNLYTSSIEEMNIESSDIKETSKNVLKSKEIIQKDKLNNCLQNENQTKAVESPNKKNSINSIQKKITEEKIILRNNKQKNIRGKKRSQSKDLNNITKKQKFITIHDDSNNTESSNDEQELELPISPENLSSSISKDSKSPPQMKFENGKRKVLKIVDKTFEEDGFLVTKKVHVYESCSEDELEILAKKSMIPESHLEFKRKKNTKQTTLMNFFKKS